ncbi:hypothetical protein BC833DRAFT_520575, partial [Globomyces pollinis-pini]
KKQTQEEEEEAEVNMKRLRIKKAWDMALSPAKSIPMNGFMLYMSGNSVQIFSIMVTVMLLYNSLNSIYGSVAAFERFQSEPNTKPGLINNIIYLVKSPLLLPILAFCLMQLANFGLGVWKCSGMGLLPTTTSDWLAFLDAKQVILY